MKKFYILLFTISVLNLPSSCQYFQGVKRYYRPVEIIRYLGNNRFEATQGNRFKRMKLIGVNVPEKWKVMKLIRKYKIPRKFHKKILNQRYRAEGFLEKSIHPGDVLYVQGGFKRRDKYGNYLVYMYLPDLSMLNEEFIKNGYSIPYTECDNNRYRKKFYSAFLSSIENKNGLWRIWGKDEIKELKKNVPFSVVKGKAEAYKIQGKKNISIMTFNVENLFDTKHDCGRNDYAYLPLSKKKDPAHIKLCNSMRRGRNACLKMDWSENILRKKMQRLAGAVLAYNNGIGADVLILQEVENFGILNRFRKEYLKKAGYHTAVLIDGKDYRGIDIAILSRLPLVKEPVLHDIPFWPEKSSRGILEATLLLPKGKFLHVFGLHFPSQASTVKFRIQAIKHLNKLRSRLPEHAIVIAAGDCNITSDEEKEFGVLREYADPDWIVSNFIGRMKQKGSTYYEVTKKWSFFDIILFSKNLSERSINPCTWVLNRHTIFVNTSFSAQVSSKGTPERFKMPNYRGVSDHWPVVAELRLR